MSHTSLALSGVVPAYLPSPPESVWYLGPLPLRAYALSILLGIFVAMWVGDRRWVARGGAPGTVYDIAMWVVPFGIVGGRLYHVATDWATYFGPNGLGVAAALKVWNGGLGIWGAVALGSVGAWIACRRRALPLPPMLDSLSVGVALAQAIGRWGNWFNQELFGGPTDLPWGLRIDPANRPEGYEQYEVFHPTFLYESLWLVAVAGFVTWADRRYRMGHGRVFALYIATYCLGRLGMEFLRIDPATQVGGLRINIITAVLVGLGAVAYLLVSLRMRPGREDPALLGGPVVHADGAGAGDVADTLGESVTGSGSSTEPGSTQTSPTSTAES